jgi:hypothetical protein
MSNSSPPRRRPPHLREDEPIALLIALLSFGAIFFWVLNQSQGRFSLGDFLKKASETNAPQVVATPPFPLPAEMGSDTDTIKTNRVNQNGRVADSAQPPTTGSGGAITSNLSVGMTPAPSPSISIPTPPTSPSIVTQTPPPMPSITGLAPVPPINPSGNLAPAKPLTPLSFADVPKTYWAYPFITALAAQGIVSGFPDGSFKPDKPVSRGEFAIQVQKAYVKPIKLPAIAFKDMPPDDKRLVAVDQAVKANFMSGYPDKTFRPDQQVSRMEAAVSMARGLELPLPPDPDAILQPYRDQNQVPQWARSRIAAAIQAGLMAGDQDTKQLNPNSPASRADIVVLVYKGQKLQPK